MNKRIFGCLLAGMLAGQSLAQESSTLSPYSQYGLGVLADQSLGFNRAMGGIGIGLRNGHSVNMQNPASYSAVDSLTMLFDMGLSAKITNYKEGNKSVNAKTGNFDYAVASFRLLKHVGVAVGIVPFSHIGYDYESTDKSTSTTEAYSGDGGCRQVFLGMGWEFAKGFSAGFNFSYFWGNYDKGVLLSNSDATMNYLTRSYSTSIRSYKLDLGFQWQHSLDANNLLTVGLTTSIGHKLNANADVVTTTTNPQTSVTTTSTPTELENAFSLPWAFGVGATLLHKKNLTAGFDYTLQKWSSIDFPVYDSRGYSMTSNYYRDRHQIAVGADWIPNPMSRNYLNQVHYRIGASYATPYYKIKDADGPKELTLSAGFGLPISRSMVHISGQWVHSKATGFVTENTFRINIGLTFNERWFAKWKVD